MNPKMMRHLDNARLELRSALEKHEGANELDPPTRLILEAFRAITAVRQTLHRGTLGEDGDRRGLARELT